MNTIEIRGIGIGKIDAKLGKINNPGSDNRGKDKSMTFDYPDKITSVQAFIQNRDTKYVKCTTLDLPDALILEKPICKICPYFDHQYAIFHNNTDYFITIDRNTLAIKNAKQLEGSHLPSSGLVAIDAMSNYNITAAASRHLYYAYHDAGKRKTIVVDAEGMPVTEPAKTCFVVWHADGHVFDRQTGVVRPVMAVYNDGSVAMLTDEGLAFYHIDEIKASKGKPIKPRSSIALVEASHCLQSFSAYAIDGGAVFIVLTDKRRIKHVQFKDAAFALLHTAGLPEGLMSKAVFSCVKCYLAC